MFMRNTVFWKRFTAVLAAIFAICLCTTAFARTPGSPSFPGEAINANPESLRAEHEESVLKIALALGRYACDEAGSDAVRRYVLEGSVAESYVDRFDNGWFSNDYKYVTFENGRTGNYTGNGQDAFECDVYMDCIAKIDADESMFYDMAYHFSFVRDKRGDWKLTSFANLPQLPDRADLPTLNTMDMGISIEAVTGPTFKGFLMIVADPSRVYVGVYSNAFDVDAYGYTLDRFAEKYQATAVINGGGFADPNGMGKGGKPNGIVITEGTFLQGHTGGTIFGTVIGFDENDRLVVRSDLTKQEAKDLALRDAVAFSPALILDGEPIDNGEYRSEISCRSAIGQRADGAVLMLVADGRQPDSLGACIADMTRILLQYGAVTAANLDGGTSTALLLGGVKVNDGTSPRRVSRNMPTAFIVR